MTHQSTNQTQQHTVTSPPLSNGVFLKRQHTSCGQYASDSDPYVHCSKLGFSEPARISDSQFEQNFSQIPVSSGKPFTLQPKLTIGKPNNRYEQEADRVADQVLQKLTSDSAISGGLSAESTSLVQRQCANCQSLSEKHTEADKEESSLQLEELVSTAQTAPYLQRKLTVENADSRNHSFISASINRDVLNSSATPQRHKPLPIQRQTENSPENGTEAELLEEDLLSIEVAGKDEDQATVQNKKADAIESFQNAKESPDLEAELSRSRSSGTSLPRDTQQKMQTAFGADFSQVQIHTDQRADSLARSLHAKAFTTGNHIYFRNAHFDTSSSQGKRLIAHELTHVVQQQPYLQEIPSSQQRNQEPQLVSADPASKSFSAQATTATQPLKLIQRDNGDGKPETNRRLLAHELTHVIRQSEAGPQIQRESSEGAEQPELVLPPELSTDVRLPKFTFWINGFIPSDLKGAVPVPAGPEKGKMMFPGPFATSDCFLTDNRGFSNNRVASSRVHVEGVVDLETRSLLGSALFSSGTKELDCEDGDVECSKRAAVSGSVTTGSDPKDPNLFYIKINDVAASDPCVTGAPKLDLNGTITLNLNPNPLNQTFSIEIYIEPFPDFEMYAHLDDGPPKTLFQHPMTDTSLFSLFGGPTSRVKSKKPWFLYRL